MAGLIAINKGGCWGCAYETTCSCSDGQPLVCKIMEPTCAAGLEKAIINGCYECVDPLTCEAVKCDNEPTCTDEQTAIDSDDDGCLDQCVCAIAIDCLPGYVPADTNGDGCDDTCEQSQCGGIAGLLCAQGLFCEMGEGQCGSADLFGTCTLIPENCPLNVAEVCGCDGKTYTNDCFRAMAMVSLDHPGACVDDAECKDGETKEVDCNTCSCTGGQWMCTLILCPECSDDKPCPSGQNCIMGQCQDGCSGDADCDDGKACTVDTCDPESGCKHAFDYTNYCAISGADDVTCVANGTAHPTSPCQICDTDKSSISWTGSVAACDDGNPCTTNTCSLLGQCNTESLAVGTACGNGMICNSAAECITPECVKDSECGKNEPCKVYECQSNNCVQTVSLIDGVSCGAGMVCEQGECVDDGLCDTDAECVGDDACMMYTCSDSGDCLEAPMCPDDGNPCTKESCDPDKGMCNSENMPDKTPCGDDKVCDAGVCVTIGGTQGTDISGWHLIGNKTGTTTVKTFAFPAGTVVQPGGVVVVGRNADAVDFSYYWGAMPKSTLYFKGNNSMPVINGTYTYRLVDTSGNDVDGPTVSANKGSLHRNSTDAANAAHWTALAETQASPGVAPSTTGFADGSVFISEMSDASGTGNYVYEFIEITFLAGKTGDGGSGDSGGSGGGSGDGGFDGSDNPDGGGSDGGGDKPTPPEK